MINYQDTFYQWWILYCLIWVHSVWRKKPSKYFSLWYLFFTFIYLFMLLILFCFVFVVLRIRNHATYLCFSCLKNTVLLTLTTKIKITCSHLRSKIHPVFGIVAETLLNSVIFKITKKTNICFHLVNMNQRSLSVQ